MDSVLTELLHEDLKRDYWVTRDGRLLYPADFTDDHLLNLLRYFERNFASLRDHLEFYAGLLLAESLRKSQADAGTQHAAFLELEAGERRSMTEWLRAVVPLYRSLYQEAVARGLLHD